MANMNTFGGWQNIPAQSITVNTETALLVPAAGLYPGLPSPQLPAAAGLFAAIPADIVGSVVDGHPFKVRYSGKAFTGASITFATKLYQVPATIVAAGTQATVGNDNSLISLAASAAFTGAANFCVEGEFMWDSTSGKLNGWTTAAQVNGVNIVPNGGTAGTLVATSIVSVAAISGLNFMPSFTFGTANANNTVTVVEFVIDRA